MRGSQKASWDSSERQHYEKVKWGDPYRLKGMKDRKQPAVMCGDLNRIREEAVQGDWVRISARIPLVGMPVFRAGLLPGPAQN